MRSSGPLPMLAAAAELLDGEDLDAATDAALATQLRGLWVAICRLQAQLSRRVAVFDERGAAARDGARGIRGWLLGGDALGGGGGRILLQHARREPPGRLRRLSRRFRERGGPREAVDAFRRVRAHRFLDVVRAGTGAVNIRGQLDVSDGELLL